MAKLYTKIGFAETEETAPGVWLEVIHERSYKVDVTRNLRRLNSDGDMNDDLSLTNEVSVLMDGFLPDHFFKIRYIWWHGAKWKVTTAEILYPRLRLTIGTLYNG